MSSYGGTGHDQVPEKSVCRKGRSRASVFRRLLRDICHGNVAGIGQALQQNEDFPYYLSRNEQAMVHTAVAFSKMSNRLRAFACTSSIGPGATNMVSGLLLVP